MYITVHFVIGIVRYKVDRLPEKCLSLLVGQARLSLKVFCVFQYVSWIDECNGNGTLELAHYV